MEQVRDSLLHKALGEVEFPENYDPNKIPQTGEEYLHYVIYEAKRCKSFTVAEKKFDEFSNRQTVFTQVIPSEVVPRKCIYNEKWQNIQIADFSAFRSHVQKMRTVFVPDPKFQFSADKPTLEKTCSTVPKASDLLNLTVKNISRMLEVFNCWYSRDYAKNGLEYSYNVWLYAVLSVVHTPLLPSDASLLRDIGRKISRILADLPEDTSEEVLLPLNIFLCVIIKYFKNNDLISIV